MYRKHVKQVVGITLKHFFDLDETFIIGVSLIVLALLSICKLYLTDGWDTVKADAQEIRTSIIEYRQRWANSETHENLANTLRTIKNNVVGKMNPLSN